MARRVGAARGEKLAAVTATFSQRVTVIEVARELGEDEDWLFDIFDEIESEDGIIRVYGPPLGKDGTVAFSAFGVENV